MAATQNIGGVVLRRVVFHRSAPSAQTEHLDADATSADASRQGVLIGSVIASGCDEAYDTLSSESPQ